MSFVKISDPDKRDFIVDEFLKTRRNIQKNFMAERVDNIDSERELSKFFKPVIDSQKEIVSEIKPLADSIKELPKAITFPQYPSIQAIEDVQAATASVMNLEAVATEYLKRFASKTSTVDKTYGIYDTDGKFFIGDKEIEIKGNNIVIDDNEYEGTNGLWELITMKIPDPEIYSSQDFNNYKQILLSTNALKQNHDPSTRKPKSSKAWKWNYLLKPIWEGKGIFLPSDPNALVQRLELLMASKAAGNTGVRNELVSICDELLRQNIIDRESYKKINMNI